MSDRWLKELLMLPSRIAVRRLANAEQKKYDTRQRFGNPEFRATCCAARSQTYERGTTRNSVPDLASLLEPTVELKGGISPFYCCKVCGQEWVDEWEQIGHGGYQTLHKVVS